MDATTVTFDKRVFLLKTYAISIALVVLYLLMYWWFSVATYKIVALALFASFLMLGYWLTKVTFSLRATSHFYIICCYFFLCFGTATSSGIGNPGSIWFLFCPLVSFITLSSFSTRIWLAIILITLCAFYFLEDYVVIDQFRGGKHWFLIANVLQFGTVYYIIKIFRNEVSKKRHELEVLNELLQAKQARLEVYQFELMEQHDKLEVAESLAVERNDRLGEYLNQLLDISRMEELHTGSLDLAILTVQRILLKTMTLDSVRIWHLDEGGEQLNLIGKLASKNDVSQEPAILVRGHAPETLEILESGVIILSPNEHGELQQLNLPFDNSGTKPSTIACPYFIDGKFAGFFSCCASDRKWSAEDVIFVRAISDALPLAFKSHQRKKQQLLLEGKQRQIEELNDSLEKKVASRTTELKFRNEQLTKFAFINAHNIRGPVCRLQGLRNLLMLAEKPEDVFLLRDFISSCVEELDVITRKASKLLEDVSSPGES
jgi:hypothetical protein